MMPSFILMLQKFLSRQSFSTPELFVLTSAFGHVPFFFWLISVLKPRVTVELGSADGYTFFAFCQAAREFPMRVFAIDTWKGDAHTGPLPERMYRSVQSNLAGHFSGVDATMLRMTFDEAVGRFDDGSLDLVFVDGCHSYDAVTNDYLKWKPKMSDKGVMVFHDTAVHRPGFGVHRFWDEVTNECPGFHFPHDHGLGVLPVGRNVPEVIRDLAGLSGPVRHEVEQAYATLGSRLTQIWEVKGLEEEIRRRDERIESLQQSLSWKLTAPLRALDHTLRGRK